MSPPEIVALAGGPSFFCPAPDHPCPGVGVPAAAVFLAETAGRAFPTGAQLASYVGLTPVTRRSGSSIRGEVRLSRGQQAPQASHVPVSLRLTALRPHIPRLLRPQTRPGQAPQPGRTRPRPPPLDKPHRGPAIPGCGEDDAVWSRPGMAGGAVRGYTHRHRRRPGHHRRASGRTGPRSHLARCPQ
ncbi:hypothetical protein DRB07_14525 [Actinomyces sp. Z3]|nr:hypothetical protein DRB07_14525 [Actinomyces sp. Z3]